jgi:hypothetical protein
MKPPRTLGLASAQPSWVALQRHLEQVSKVLTNISFGVTTSNTDPSINMAVYKATGTTPVTPNTEFAVAHNLTHIPIGFLIASTTPAGHIYKSTTAWTAATPSALGNIYLKSDTASVTYVLILL